MTIEPGKDYRELFIEPETLWLSPEARLDEKRLWAEYALLRVELPQNRGERKIHVVHIGLGGVLALHHFINPHNIRLERIIGKPS